MADRDIRKLEKAVAENPGDEEMVMRLRLARIRMGIEEVPQRTYRVLELNLTGLQKKVASYAKRAKKLNVIPLEIRIGEERHFEKRGDTILVARDVTIVGDAPDLGDWQLCARLEHLKEETVIREFIATEEVETFRERGPVCDHCKVRRIRKDTFAVRHRETREVLQVGRTCLEEFCGANPKGALYLFDVDQQLRDLAKNSSKILERCKACKKMVTPVVTLESPHGTCPDCKGDLEGQAIRSYLVPMAHFLIALSDPRRRDFSSNGLHRAWSCAVWKGFEKWEEDRLADAGERAMATIAWAQDQEGNAAAVLRDSLLEHRHAGLAVEGYYAARVSTPTNGNGTDQDIPMVQFAWIRNLRQWGVRGSRSDLQVGNEVMAHRKDGSTQMVRVLRINRTFRDGNAIATFEKA